MKKKSNMKKFLRYYSYGVGFIAFLYSGYYGYQLFFVNITNRNSLTNTNFQGIAITILLLIFLSYIPHSYMKTIEKLKEGTYAK